MKRTQRNLGFATAAIVVAQFLAPCFGARGSVAFSQTTSGSCQTAGAGSGADACQKGRDLFAFVMPQIGVALSGGNPIPGEGGTVGGPGHGALSVRVSAAEGFLPRNSVPIISALAPQASDFGAARTYVPIPTVDLALGLFAGIPMGLTNVGGVDLLGGVTYVPEATVDELNLSPSSGKYAFSYGVRVGLLQESSMIPGISASYMRRRLPTQNLLYTPNSDTLDVRGIGVNANTVRIAISKRVLIFGLAAGVGRDVIEGEGAMRGVVNNEIGNNTVRTEVSLAGLKTRVERNTAFVNASFGVAGTRLVAEYGWSSAGTIEETLNQFGGRRANESYRYGSAGLTIRF